MPATFVLLLLCVPPSLVAAARRQRRESRLAELAVYNAANPSVGTLTNDMNFTVDYNVAALPGAANVSKFMNRYTVVFGVHVFASENSEDWFIQHVSRVLAKWLDQDEDGNPDHPEVVQAMVARKAAMVLAKSEEEYDRGIGTVADKVRTTLEHGVIKNDHPVWNCSVSDVWVVAEEFQEETPRDATHPYGKVPPGPAYGRDDAGWEEVFHLITHVGYGCAHPEVFGFRADALHPYAYPSSSIPESNISRILDSALGDCGAAYNHTQTGRKATRACPYHYGDETCFYPCLVNEYLNFLHLAHIGARDYQYADARDEYLYANHEECRAHDPLGFAIGGSAMLPQIPPSGHYAPSGRGADSQLRVAR